MRAANCTSFNCPAAPAATGKARRRGESLLGASRSGDAQAVITAAHCSACREYV